MLLYDRAPAQIERGLKLMDKLLAKDVSKGKIRQSDATEARERVTIIGEDGIKAMRDVDMIVEVSRSIMLV